jgi:peptidoglycan/LPS O-acetylase OafA/YrhL
MDDVVVASRRRARGGDRPYRLEIEGLRGIAVLAVLLFHVGAGLPGGYVGVDIFFVISGFLITGNILRDRQSGVFTFRRFYLRRIRRLFPALAATLLLTLAAGFIVLAPDDMARLGRSALFSAASLANVVFWRETGYFDAAATLQPLLHTWSLSVEEQFYVIWPAAIVLAFRFGRSSAVAAMVIGAGMASWLSAELLRSAHPGAVFYLAPFRLFELAAGAVLAVVPRRPPQHWLATELAMIAGLSAIAYAVALFDASTPLDHLWSLLPCLGAALVIFAGDTPWCGRLLSNRLITAVGAISYSLYLVHWPIVVFYKYVRPGELSGAIQALLVLLSVALAMVMYRLVERPFRSGRRHSAPISARASMLTGATVAALIAAVGGHAWYTNGWAFRMPADLGPIPTETEMWTERNPVARVGSCFLYEKSRPDLDEDRCLALDPARPNYLIVGDSFAADAYVYLSTAYPAVNFLQATAGNCHPLIDFAGDRICTALLRQVIDTVIPATPLDGVVLAAAWESRDLEPLDRTIDVLRTKTPRVVLVGSGLRFQANVSALIYRSKLTTKDGVERYVAARIAPFVTTLNDIARQRFRAKAAAYIDVQSVACEGRCRIFTPAGEMIYIDFGHLTLAGSRYLAPRIASRYADVFPRRSP